MTARAGVSFLILAQAGRVVGSVTAFRVQQGNHEASVPAGISLPISFVAVFTARGRQLTFSAPPTAAPCPSGALGIAQSLRDLWFQTPDTLRLGTTWTDSISYPLCRDGVPLRARVRRSFRVTGADSRAGGVVLTISRTAHGSLEGDGEQFGEPVHLTGSSTGELSYLIAPAVGEILSAQGSAVLEFTLRSRLRTQRAHQNSEIRIERGP
ncbi:MAG TPA: hypothetical protein VJL28_12040 [Gemmatimonadaceae bacterium]|nr:hypothetical protein [Gemmatimonadaceae bacterium]